MTFNFEPVQFFACIALMLLGLVAGGCANQKNKQQNRFGDLGHVATMDLPTPRAPIIEEPPQSAPTTLATVSQNAAEQSLTGIGANIAKLADNVEASLVRVDARIDSLFKASVEVQNSIKADVRTTLQSHFIATNEVSATALAAVEARLTAHVDAKFTALANAQAQAIAGFNNSIQSMQQNVSAGRDSSVNNYADQMFRANQTSDRTNMWTIIAMCLVIVIQSERSRMRAEHRANGGKGDKQCEVGFIRRCLRRLY